jgi:hypothetical protein
MWPAPGLRDMITSSSRRLPKHPSFGAGLSAFMIMAGLRIPGARTAPAPGSLACELIHTWRADFAFFRADLGEFRPVAPGDTMPTVRLERQFLRG